MENRIGIYESQIEVGNHYSYVLSQGLIKSSIVFGSEKGWRVGAVKYLYSIYTALSIKLSTIKQSFTMITFFSFLPKLYNGIEKNPNFAGSGLVKFGCTKYCLDHCESSKFQFWNRERLELDPSLTLVCQGKKKVYKLNAMLTRCKSPQVTFKIYLC